MKRHRKTSSSGHASCPMPSPFVLPLCLLAIMAGACSVDLGKLRGPLSSVPDGAADLPGIPDVTGAGDSGHDGSGTDSLLVSPDLPAGDVVAIPGDAKDLPESAAVLDGSAPDLVTDSSDLAAAGEDASDASPDLTADLTISGSGGSGGAGGTGGSGGAAGVDADASGGSGGTAGADADASGGAAEAGIGETGIDSDGDSGGTTGGAGGAGGAGGTGGAGGAGVDPDLVLWYKFDESSGTIAADSSPSGGGLRDGTLGTVGTGGRAIFSTDCQVGTHALSLVSPTRPSTPAGGYVTTPAPAALAPGALTIALWVRLTAATSYENWERIFDFGSGSTEDAYLYLTARASDATSIPLRFGISNTGHTTAAEQRLESPSALSAGAWHHIAIVLPAGATYTGVLYLNGVAVATNKAMTLHLSDIGTTTLNWLGRSPFSADPLFNGSLDDFRIYQRALSATEIAALFAIR